MPWSSERLRWIAAVGDIGRQLIADEQARSGITAEWRQQCVVRGKYAAGWYTLFMPDDQGNIDECLSILIATGRLPEAAMFARTYCPSQAENVLQMWKEKVGASSKVAQSLASPKQYPNLFPDVDKHLQAEKVAPVVLDCATVAVSSVHGAAPDTGTGLPERAAQCRAQCHSRDGRGRRVWRR